jgi:hypothetical protein
MLYLPAEFHDLFKTWGYVVGDKKMALERFYSAEE